MVSRRSLHSSCSYFLRALISSIRCSSSNIRRWSVSLSLSKQLMCYLSTTGPSFTPMSRLAFLCYWLLIPQVVVLAVLGAVVDCAAECRSTNSLCIWNVELLRLPLLATFSLPH